MSFLGLPSNHYKLPYSGCAISPVYGENFPDADTHVFMAGTNCPFKPNELHFLQYFEGNGEATELATFPFQNEITALRCFHTTRNNTDFNCLAAIASKSEIANKQSTCELYNIDVGYYPNLALVTKFNESTPFKGIQKILSDPHAETGTNTNRMAVVDFNGFSIFELTNGADELTYKSVGAGHTNQLRCYSGSFDPHHFNLFITVDSQTLLGWDLRVNKTVYSRPKPHSTIAMDVDYNPNVPNFVATGGQDGSIRFWDIRHLEKPLNVLEDVHSHWVTSVRYNPCHDQLLLSAGTDASVKLHQMEALENAETPLFSNVNAKKPLMSPGVIHNYEDHQDSIYDICWSGNDAWCFAAISNDGRISVNQVPSEEKYRILL